MGVVDWNSTAVQFVPLHDIGSTSTFWRRRDLKGWLAKTVWRACGFCVGVLGAGVLCPAALWGQAAAPAAKVRFETEVLPLLKDRCQKCHTGEKIGRAHV